MEDSIELDQSDNEQPFNHNQFQFSSVVSPKARRLTKGLNTNTASHESLAYSNSTYNKNQFTERSPPMFNMDTLSNNQNVNTMNFKPFDRKQSTFGSGKGLAIQFDKIKEESYLDDSNHRFDQTSSREKIDFPCFLSNENSPNNKFQFKNPLNDSLNNQEDDQNHSDISQRKTLKESGKNYKKITPSSRKQLKESIVKTIKDKIDHKETSKTVNPKDKPTKTTKLNTISSRQSNQKSTNSLISISNEQRRSKSPLSVINQSSNSFYKNPDDISALKQKIKELEYSLQVESISTEQLRTKVSVLNELLEEKFLQRNGINFKLFKNSSPSIGISNKSSKYPKNHEKQTQSLKENKSYSNIDLYVEMKVLQKAKQEMEIEYERLKNELSYKNQLTNEYASKCQQLQRQLSVLSQKTKNQIKTQTSFNLKGNVNENHVIQVLQEEKETLMKLIETQKGLLKQKDSQIESLTTKLKEEQKKFIETQSYIKLFEEKQKRFTEIERPKFIGQIKDLTEKLDNQREHIQRLEMENNLIQMQSEQGFFKDSKFQMMQSPSGKFSSGLQKSKVTNEKFGSPEMLYSDRYNHKQEERQNGMTQRSKLSQLSEPRSEAIKPLKQVTPKDNKKVENEGVPDTMTLIMYQEQELVLLKNQRDYFREQNEKLRHLEKDNFKYRLEIEDLRNEVQSLRQIISLDDSCTF